jgi:hypothetical protein
MKSVMRQFGYLVRAFPIVALASASPVLAQTSPEAALKRTGPWIMDYDDNACHLSAVFGSGETAVTTRFTQFDPQGLPRLLLSSSRFRGQSGLSTRAQVKFLPSNTKPVWSSVTNGTMPSASGVALPTVFVGAVRFDNRSSSESEFPPLPQVTPETENAVNGLSFKLSSAKPFVIDLVSMGEPMVAMRKCADNLVRSWGFDPVEISTRQSRAVPSTNPSNWIRTEDYPKGMLAKGQSAFVQFRLKVSETGSVTNCAVLEQSSPTSIGSYTCKMISERARFRPAIDREGRNVSDYYIGRLFWRVR